MRHIAELIPVLFQREHVACEKLSVLAAKTLYTRQLVSFYPYQVTGLVLIMPNQRREIIELIHRGTGLNMTYRDTHSQVQSKQKARHVRIVHRA